MKELQELVDLINDNKIIYGCPSYSFKIASIHVCQIIGYTFILKN